jgi:hypothetical protein
MMAKQRRLPVAARRDGLATMKYVYLLQSLGFPNETYVGLTDNLRVRLAKSQAIRGQNRHELKRGVERSPLDIASLIGATLAKSWAWRQEGGYA